MQWATRQKGFTLIELIIVIVVIALLVTVTVVAYNGITGQAKAVAVINSLKNASQEVQTNTLQGQILTTLPSSVNPDKDVILQLAGSKGTARDYCINAYKASPFEVKSYDSFDREIQSYPCPGALLGSPIGGTVPAVPTGVNLVADFSQWDLTGGVTYNGTTKELEFSGTTGKATSPLIRAVGTSNISMAYELFSATSAPSHTPNAGTYSGSAYFGSNGTTVVNNSSGYPTNGNSQAVPINAWTARTFSTPTGSNVHYIQFSISLAPTTWTSNNFKVRNVTVLRQG